MTNHKLATQILRRPLLTEKGTKLGEIENKVFFEVAMNANKIEIRKAVEELYGVQVGEVKTQIVRGKWKRVGRHLGQRSNWKKAIVSLKGDSKIDFFAPTA